MMKVLFAPLKLQPLVNALLKFFTTELNSLMLNYLALKTPAINDFQLVLIVQDLNFVFLILAVVIYVIDE